MGETRSVLRAIPRGFFAFFLGTILLGADGASAARRGAYALYQFSGSFDSKCVPTVASPDRVLAQNGISTRGGASSSERQALANGVAKIQHLLGGKPLPVSWRTSYNFITSPNGRGTYTWNQGAAAINVRRPGGTNGGQNETRLVHELGHKVGNAGNYARYNQAVGRKCGITPYCIDPKHKGKRNEEFADSFAAFITRPSHLKTVCPEAYAFFSQQLFPGSNAIASCGDSMDGQETLLLASAGGGGASTASGSGSGYVRNRCSKNLFCWLFKIGCPPCADTGDTASGTTGNGGSPARGSNHGGQR